jgi:hypothetical protein
MIHNSRMERLLKSINEVSYNRMINCKAPSVSNHPGFVHEHNLYYLGGRMDIGIAPGRGERIGDPLFIDLNKKDYHLNKKSPAIDAGINLNYTIDYDGKKVPRGSAPDIGAYKYDTIS